MALQYFIGTDLKEPSNIKYLRARRNLLRYVTVIIVHQKWVNVIFLS